MLLHAHIASERYNLDVLQIFRCTIPFSTLRHSCASLRAMQISTQISVVAIWTDDSRSEIEITFSNLKCSFTLLHPLQFVVFPVLMWGNILPGPFPHTTVWRSWLEGQSTIAARRPKTWMFLHQLCNSNLNSANYLCASDLNLIVWPVFTSKSDSLLFRTLFPNFDEVSGNVLCATVTWTAGPRPGQLDFSETLGRTRLLVIAGNRQSPGRTSGIIMMTTEISMRHPGLGTSFAFWCPMDSDARPKHWHA